MFPLNDVSLKVFEPVPPFCSMILSIACSIFPIFFIFNSPPSLFFFNTSSNPNGESELSITIIIFPLVSNLNVAEL